MSHFYVEELKSDCGWVTYGLVERLADDLWIHYRGNQQEVLSFLVGMLRPIAQA